MNDKKKLELILIITGVFLLTILGITFAFYNYTRTGENNKLIAGEVYLKYIENNQLTLNNAIPETKAQALLKENNIFSFKVEGKNTSTMDIFYDIIITYGDSQTGKTRLNDSDIRIYLEKDGVPIVDGITLEDWDKRVIYTDKMPALTNNHTVYNYELRMWVDENVTVSDTDTTANYTTSIWNNSYASMRINVNSGDTVSDNATPVSCFEYSPDVISPIGDAEIVTHTYPTFVYNRSDDNIATCKTFFAALGTEDMSDDQDGYQSVCAGTGTIMGVSLESFVFAASEDPENIDQVVESIGVIESYENKKKYYEFDPNATEEEVTACMTSMMLMTGEDNSDAQDGYQSFCSGTGTVGEANIIELMNYDAVDSKEMKVLKKMLIASNVFKESNSYTIKSIEITNYDASCGSEVVIPAYIAGMPVTSIADVQIDNTYNPVSNSSFYRKNITSVTFPNTLTYIGTMSFVFNDITNVVIPDNVIEVGDGVFLMNPDLTNVEVGSGCRKIGRNAFTNEMLTNVKIKGNPSIGNGAFSFDTVINNFAKFEYGGTCAELNNSPNIFSSETQYMPQTIITSDSNSCVYNSWQ